MFGIYCSEIVAFAEISLFRLYTVRFSYLVLALGLVVCVWPSVIHYANEFAAAGFESLCWEACEAGAKAVLGLKYLVRMPPLLRLPQTRKRL